MPRVDLSDTPLPAALAQTPAGSLETWDPAVWPANFHYIDASLDRYFTVDDYDELTGSGKYFVRKVTSARSSPLLDKIDADIDA